MSPIKTTEGGEKLEAGVYEARFSHFAARDEETNHPLVKETEWGQRVYFNLAVHDGANEGVFAPVATNPGDGLDFWFKTLTGQERPKGKSLLEIEGLMEEGSKTIKVQVNENGWVRGLYIPKGTYLARFQRFSVRDEQDRPVWKEQEYKGSANKKVYWQFEIVAGDLKGTSAPGSCSYAIKKVSGELAIASKSNLYCWAGALGVDFAELPDPKDQNNVLPEIERGILAASKVVSIQIGENGWIDSSQGAIAPPPAGVSVGDDVPKVEEEFGSDKLADLYAAMQRTASKQGFGDLFAKDGSFTEEGKRFAKEVLGPLCDESSIPRKFSRMEEAHIVYLIERLAIDDEEAGKNGSKSKEDEEF
jgi:hypothetical protein